MLPSEIRTKSYTGYRNDVFAGWMKLDDATIIGDGYKVEFYRLSERTIDIMCDALNGWYNVWTKFRCEYTDSKGTLSVTLHNPEDADKLFTILENVKPLVFEHEGTVCSACVARSKMGAIIDLVQMK